MFDEYSIFIFSFYSPKKSHQGVGGGAPGSRRTITEKMRWRIQGGVQGLKRVLDKNYHVLIILIIQFQA